MPTSNPQPPRLAITLGDPAGISPEIVLKALAALAPEIAEGRLALTVYGCGRSLTRTAGLLGLPNPLQAIPAEADGPEAPPLALVEAGPAEVEIATGQVSAEAGRLAYRAIALAVEAALAGRVAALCTAPLNKEALNLAGYPFAGHTELLAHLTGVPGSVMMLAHGPMRVSHVSTNVALTDVPARLTPERLRHVIAVTRAALQAMGIPDPLIAVAALNPHAGEGGLFGREDLDVTLPVVQALAAEGQRLAGPIPGDIIFVRLRAGVYDAAVAIYHDQGHIPVKLLGFQVDAATGRWEALNGVNLTLGLPILRTSVDHGTAFDIAGKGIASADSLIEAIAMARRLAIGRNAGAAAIPAASPALSPTGASA